jgi:hypothetical protein
MLSKALAFFLILALTAATAHADTAADKAEKAADRCAVAKLTAATKKIAAEVKCYEAALKKGKALDFQCIGKAGTKFFASFDKAEHKGGCTVTGDATTIHFQTEATVARLLADEPDTRVCVFNNGFGCAFPGTNCCPGFTCSFATFAVGVCVGPS